MSMVEPDGDLHGVFTDDTTRWGPVPGGDIRDLNSISGDIKLSGRPCLCLFEPRAHSAWQSVFASILEDKDCIYWG